jgi:hypothetical protein
MRRRDISKSEALSGLKLEFGEPTSVAARHEVLHMRPIATLTLLAMHLLMIGCNAAPLQTPTVKSQVSQQQPALATNRSAVAPPTNSATHPALEALFGVWQVVGVSVSENGPTAFIPNDPSILGSQITINKDLLVWSKTTSSNFTSEDRCNEPNLRQSPVAPTSPSELSEFVPAARQFSVSLDKDRLVQTWLCDGGGDWGPSADSGSRMIQISQDRILMGWYDGVTLLLERAKN